MFSVHSWRWSTLGNTSVNRRSCGKPFQRTGPKTEKNAVSIVWQPNRNLIQSVLKRDRTDPKATCWEQISPIDLKIQSRDVTRQRSTLSERGCLQDSGHVGLERLVKLCDIEQCLCFCELDTKRGIHVCYGNFLCLPITQLSISRKFTFGHQLAISNILKFPRSHHHVERQTEVKSGSRVKQSRLPIDVRQLTCCLQTVAPNVLDIDAAHFLCMNKWVNTL